ncbi:T9SS type A sorting domain-containing protein [uncultured Draconibacterium sp.]|uniref:leucine-rich repeat domain-containing protein n=1 Tax=uncultured Draconibacterium sp. TaxID=1573823 RepID=UPI002AA69AB4|nr:T9SS type A sorting domain-containing protein [uncultured Draconibacterium sp.]
MKKIFFLLVVVCITVSSYAQSDSLILVNLYNSSGGLEWNNNSGWLESGVPISDWEGIQTDENGNVTSINLPGQNMSGIIPDELGQLLNLRTLDFSNNGLTGVPPNSLFNLPQLTGIWLTENNFDPWELPSEFYNQTSLISVRIESCSITGELDPLIGNLNQLVTLEIRGNDFSGSIPEEIGGLTSVEELRLGNNNFTGAIPQGIYTLMNLKDLDVSHTNIDGTFSESITALGNLRYLGMTGIGMTGVLPSGLCQLPFFERIDLAYNNFDNQSCPVVQCLIDNNVQIVGSQQEDGFDLVNDCNLIEITPRENDSLALVALYNATNGSNWVNNSGWLEPGVPISNWYGVTVENERVTGIDLKGNWDGIFGLQGEIPADIGSLTELVFLDFSFNILTGPIPIELWNLSNLEYLSLGWGNQLNGTIPYEIQNLSKLKYLDLSSNQLSGQIPIELYNIISLEFLNLDNNQITDTISVEISNLVNLNILNLGRNQIAGDIPKVVGNLINLGQLHLYQNQLSGTIPIEIGNLINIYELNLADNQLAGSIPEEIGNMTKLDWLWLHNNQLNGIIPMELCQTPITQIDFSNNYFDSQSCPAIQCLINNYVKFSDDYQFQQSGFSLINDCNLISPENLREQDSLALVALYNSTDGPDWINNSGWLQEGVKIDNWYGIGVSNNRVISLGLSGNDEIMQPFGLNGIIPAEIGNLTELRQLNLRYNYLSGSIPAEIGNLTKLTSLYLGDNDLAGAIPGTIGNLINLYTLDLIGNQLIGNLPTQMGNMVNLQYINIDWNNLEGPIPIEFGNLINLETLALYENNLSGTIPTELGELNALKLVGLGANNLEGEIPTSFEQLQNLEHFTIRDNNLEGVIPAGFCNLNLQLIDFGGNNFDSRSCETFNCIIENGAEINVAAGDPLQTQKSGFSLVNDCRLLDPDLLYQDSLALVALYNATDGPNWTNNSGWLEPGIPIYEWYGVTVEGDRVGNLELFDNNLVGSLPEEYFNLTGLTTIGFRDEPNLTGQITSSIGNLENLNNFHVWNTGLSGELPEELGNCAKLGELVINHNNFSGIIPQSLCNTPVYELNFEGNNFSAESCSIIACLLDNGAYFIGDPYQIQKSGIALAIDCGRDMFAVSESDSLALVAFYNATGGAEWINNSGWLEPGVPVTEWFGVGAVDGRVHSIELFSNNLSGYIPDEFYNLTGLVWLGLHDNPELGGELSPLIGNLTELTDIHSNSTGFTGVLPTEVGNCTNLTTLFIEYNNFEGGIPAELCNTALLVANFDGNYFTNESCSAMECFLERGVVFEGNSWQEQRSGISLFEVCGLLPPAKPCAAQDSLALVALYNATDGDNWFDNKYWLSEYPVSIWPGVMVYEGRVRELGLCDNNLNGELPVEFYNLTGLRHFSLCNNNLYGNLLSQIADFAELRDVDFNSTQLGGELPVEIGNIEFLNSLFIGECNFTGIVPETLCNTALVESNFEGNYFTKESCSTMQCLVDKGVFFSGDPYQTQKTGMALAIECGRNLNAVPESDSLALVDLYNSTGGKNWKRKENWLEGPVFTWYGITVEDNRVSQINLGWNNNLIGELPSSMVNLDALQVLILYGNQISGELPSDIHLMTALRVLQLGYNQLSGELPFGIWNLPNLEQIQIWNNQFSGELPEEIGNLQNLNVLSIAANQFNGSLPVSLQYCSRLEQLLLNNNYFTGAVPIELCGLPLIRARFDLNNFDNGSCPAIRCLNDNGVLVGDPDQIQRSGFSLINGCSCTTPEIEYLISSTEDPVQLGNEISLSFFSPSGYIENAYWEWGDGTVTEVDVEGEIVTTHLYLKPGVFAPKLILNGCEVVIDTSYRYIVIYDPEGGFVTGGGWIESPPGASVLYPEATGKANFGFVSKYKKGSSVPEGSTEFKFTAGDLNYKSTVYDWLVVAGSKAKFKGDGTINGEGAYSFMISAIDGDVKDNGDPDKFRIKIWNKLDETVVYDNQLGAELDEDPACVIGAGSIVIHDPNTKSASINNSLLEEMKIDENNLFIFPNPFTDELNISFELFEDSKVEIDLLAINGQKICQLESSIVNSGITTKHYFTNYLNPGIYFISLKLNDKIIKVEKLVKTN